MTTDQPFYPWHIDWVSIHQDHGVGAQLPRVDLVVDRLPVICSFVYQRTNSDTGEAFISRAPRSTEGSYSTTLNILCDGQKVTVSGNPSRFCRLDNLFGYHTIDDCVAVFNKVLAFYGLPPFSKATYYIPSTLRGDERISFFTDGAIFTRFDLTLNHSVGESRHVRPFIRGISSQSIRGCLASLTSDGLTAEWFGKGRGSRRRYDKFYSKAHEMRAHFPDKLTEEGNNYLLQLIDFVESVGCIREEHEIKSMKLKDNNCYVYGLFDESDLNNLFNESREMLTRIEGINVMNFDNIANDLLINNIVTSKRTANRMQMLVHAWLNGQDMDSLLQSKTAFYNARSILLPIGIDIKVPCDVTRLNTRIHVVELKPLLVPDFYRYPLLSDVVIQQIAA